MYGGSGATPPKIFFGPINTYFVYIFESFYTYFVYFFDLIYTYFVISTKKIRERGLNITIT